MRMRRRIRRDRTAADDAVNPPLTPEVERQAAKERDEALRCLKAGEPYVPLWARLMTATIHICAGPPVCSLEDDEAIDAQKAGCPWCRRIIIDEDGNEAETGPAHA